ncbi:MAG: Crp/Fnr family transcriptional regulator [Clostridia bacterium]|nr:Crp/Fnr family transcriptional regulator [Clostridia bacterium]
MIDINEILNAKDYCHQFVKKDFAKGETITSYIEKRKQIFIMLSGEAALIRYDEKGNKDIVDFFREGSVFGEAFYNVYLNSELSVVATKKCSCLSIMYDDIVRKCDPRCKYHEELTSTLINLLFENTTHLNSRIEVISKRTIREKLHIYLETLSIESYSNKVTIPFSLTDLADFLSVNRSAMMRELKALEDDRIIQKVGKNTYRLLYR